MVLFWQCGGKLTGRPLLSEAVKRLLSLAVGFHYEEEEGRTAPAKMDEWQPGSNHPSIHAPKEFSASPVLAKTLAARSGKVPHL